MGTPNKHAELIKAWADGAEVEIYSVLEHKFVPVSNPSWHENQVYRIKPEAKPDFVLYMAIAISPQLTTFFNCDRDKSHNIKLTFDGETGKLKSAEVL